MKGKKTGGRQRGVGNKVSKPTKELMSGRLEDYFSSGRFDSDFAEVDDSKERLKIMLKLAEFIIPKAKTEVEHSFQNKSIEEQLLALV